jgi:hypothetical protein
MMEEAEEDAAEKKGDYKVESKKKVKIPEWYKDKMPKGARVFHMDDVTQEDLM